MSIWGTIYSYLYGKEIESIYQEADSAYKEAESVQDGWLYLNKSLLAAEILKQQTEMSTSEIQTLTTVLGGEAAKLNNPIYESFLAHVTQEIETLTTTIDMMGQKLSELPPDEAIRKNMLAVVEKLTSKRKELVAFKGRIILLAKVNGDIQKTHQHRVISIGSDISPPVLRKAPPLPPQMPLFLVKPQSNPLALLKKKREHEIKDGQNPYDTLIDLVQKGVTLRKLSDAEKTRQLPKDLHTDLMDTIRKRSYNLRAVESSLQEKIVRGGGFHKIHRPLPIPGRAVSKQATLQAQLEDTLFAMRDQLESSESEDNNISNSQNAEWESAVVVPIQTSSESVPEHEEDVDLIFDFSSSSSSEGAHPVSLSSSELLDLDLIESDVNQENNNPLSREMIMVPSRSRSADTKSHF